MRSLHRFLLTAFLCLCGLAPVFAQTPRVYLKFDGNLTDSSTAGLVTSVTASAGFTPTYAADRFNVASRAVVFTGGQSLQLVASSLPGNSNQALGLRNAGGTNTSFTLTAWVYFTSLGSGQGYSATLARTPGRDRLGWRAQVWRRGTGVPPTTVGPMTRRIQTTFACPSPPPTPVAPLADAVSPAVRHPSRVGRRSPSTCNPHRRASGQRFRPTRF